MEVSVIIPVYNAEKYIEKCLDSVMKQTYKKFEVIIVDDGSTDNCRLICDEYAVNDTKIKVFHQENQGVSVARNKGISSATGEWITFIDADDWIDEDFLEVLIKNMTQHNADIVISGCIKEYKSESVVLLNNIDEGVYGREQLEKQIYPKMLYYQGFYEFGILPYMWNKLYKKKLLMDCYKNINMEIYDGEDAAIIYPYLLKAKKAVVITDAKYHYRIHSQSITTLKGMDYYENVANLYLFLNCEFQQTEHYEDLLTQLDQYMRKMIWQGKPESFIEAEKHIFPFDKVPKGAKIVLYGAGLVGKTYFHQIKKINYCDVMAWVDQNYKREELKGLGVIGISDLESIQFDYIVIAIENEKTVFQIRKSLIDIEIQKNKIVV